MSSVGPGKPGKTQLIFSGLSSDTMFYPKIGNTKSFQEEYQTLFDEIAKNLDTKPVQSLDFDMTNKHANCLLVFDESCEQIYQERIC